eukprot:CAMPEP_0169269666 /NCGR_PEP_ID=MMETSP1016-20121227/48596_1 /TAXON_ID=342587 /ORGANISM="Karlodinium micrum, Strain CCMP2283" /LENGTH=34 /DNA_ID= /DNA_START= /DNA_END= /DNA_ORIENTATION=
MKSAFPLASSFENNSGLATAFSACSFSLNSNNDA